MTADVNIKSQIKIGEALFKTAKQDATGAPLINDDNMAGTVYPGEAALLYGLVLALQPQAVLEIGTGYGYSALHLAQAMSDLGREGICVHTIDPDEGRRQAAWNTVNDAGLLDYVETYEAWSPDIKAEFVFIDANHHALDVTMYLRMAEASGCLYGAIHDAAFDYDHAAQACHERRWEILTLRPTSHGGIAIIKRHVEVEDWLP